MKQKQKKEVLDAIEKNEYNILITTNHFLVKNFDVRIEEFKLPIKSRKAITEWQSTKFDKTVRKCRRIYQHDNNSEGFFIARLRKIK